MASRTGPTLQARSLRRPPPAYLQIEAELAARIQSGDLPVGSKLPPERELAALLEVSRITVRQALARLEQRGFLRRIQGSGTYVAQPKLRLDASHLRGFYETALSQGAPPQSRLIACSSRLASDHVRAVLALGAAANVLEIVRLRSTGEAPIVLETTFLPAEPLPGFVDLDLEGASIYALLRQHYGIRVERAVESLEAVAAGQPEATLLGLPVGSPLMLIERTAWSAGGLAIEYARDLYRGDRSTFVAELHHGTGRIKPMTVMGPVLGGPFRWGVATSAYQIEGAASADGKGESIWDRFAHTPGRIADGSNGDVACDHYRRWREDVALMRSLGIRAYRLSIAWTRIQPNGTGPADPRGLAFYSSLVDALLEAGIEPWVTLYHWDLPQALEDSGGWPERDTALRFGEYAAIVGRGLGDRVRHWMTINEPWEIAFRGYDEGTFAPGRRDFRAALAAAHSVLLAHGRGAEALRSAAQDPLIGLALSVVHCHPVEATPDGGQAARIADGHFNRWFLDPLFGRGYPADVIDAYGSAAPIASSGDLATIASPLDFLGLNYYYSAWVGPGRRGPYPFELREPPGSIDRTDLGWAIDPEGLRVALVRANREYAPSAIVVTESGCAFVDVVDAETGSVVDEERIAYHAAYVEACRRAVADGVPLRGYFAWTLLDNFEWERGYGPKFGLVRVDPLTLRRTPKASATWYADLIESNGASPELGGP